MNTDSAIHKLDPYGKELYEMLVQAHSVSQFTGIQVERILSFQDRIIGVTVNSNRESSKDQYPKRFKLRGKGKHGGYLDTNKFWEIFSGNPDSKKATSNIEQSIAQA